MRTRSGAAAAALLSIALAGGGHAAQPDPPGDLDLEAAQRAALAAHPELDAAGAELRARDAALRQADLPPNPELSLEVEDVAGSGAFSRARQAQTTLRLLQPIELGGDRDARAAVAARQRDVAGFDAESRRLDVLAATANAFVELLIAQEELEHAIELHDLARTGLRAAGERVRAGAALGVEETRARVAERDAALHEALGRTQLEVARRALAALWGVDGAEFGAARGDLHRLSPPPPLRDLVARAPANPDVARFEAERQERDATLALARARRIPDPRVGAGARHLAGPGDAALVFEVLVPLPLFDRQQGAIAEASERVAKSASEHAAALRAARRGLVAEHARWDAAQQEVVAIRDELLPDVRRARRDVQAAYRSGRASQLEVLAAQRAEFEAIDRMLHMLGEYHRARIGAERLAGGFVRELR